MSEGRARERRLVQISLSFRLHPVRRKKEIELHLTSIAGITCWTKQPGERDNRGEIEEGKFVSGSGRRSMLIPPTAGIIITTGSSAASQRTFGEKIAVVVIEERKRVNNWFGASEKIALFR